MVRGRTTVCPLGVDAPDPEGTMITQDPDTTTPRAEGSSDYLTGLLIETALGSHQAFTDFYNHTCSRVFGIARKTVIDPHLSEEVTQEVFLAVWSSAGKYNPEAGSPLTWLMTIAHRRAVDKVRSHQNDTTRQQRWAAATQTLPYDEVAESVCDRIEAQRLNDSLACLTELQHQAIVLAYFGSLTYSEVAHTLSTPIPTIKSRIRAGLKQLRNQMETAAD